MTRVLTDEEIVYAEERIAEGDDSEALEYLAGAIRRIRADAEAIRELRGELYGVLCEARRQEAREEVELTILASTADKLNVLLREQGCSEIGSDYDRSFAIRDGIVELYDVLCEARHNERVALEAEAAALREEAEEMTRKHATALGERDRAEHWKMKAEAQLAEARERCDEERQTWAILKDQNNELQERCEKLEGLLRETRPHLGFPARTLPVRIDAALQERVCG